jgi:ubiquinone/menaquinone biosynthesis C-methylase UbiE
MSAAHSQVASAPFDAVAAKYDQSFTYSRIGQAQRAAVWRELSKTFRAGECVLEIGCGTGIDACFLAERGVRVVARDPSSRMIAVLKRRVHNAGLQNLIEGGVLAAEDIGAVTSKQLFDGAFSNFGAINCIQDFRKLAVDLARMLKPGATALLCWMGPWCLWELVWYLLHGNPRKALRRLKGDGARARIADGVLINVRYPSVRLLTQAFTPEFKFKAVVGIGVAVPPSYLEPWAQRHLSWLQICEGADAWLGRCVGIRHLGDHVLVRLERVK